MAALSGFEDGVARNGRREGPWTPMVRKLGSLAAALEAQFKGLTPYVAMALVVPGGSLLAPLLWFYRRQRKQAAYPRPLNTLLKDAGQAVSRR
jgi:hypothetical protein